MIILDTNVVSEPLRPRPDAAVLKWLDAQAPETLYFTTINLAELLAGIEVLPPGKKRSALQNALDLQVRPLFEGRILPFEQDAAQAFARVAAVVKAKGHTMSFADCAITAIAAANNFAVATRNIADFQNTGVMLINPWQDSG